MKTNFLFTMLLSVIALLCSASCLHAQFVTDAKMEMGARQFNGSLGSSKFTEYRDLRAGLFANMFSLTMIKSDATEVLSLWGTNIGQRDQNLNVQLAMPGKLKLNLQWDEIPHNYTNSARTVFSGAGSGVLLMPSIVRNRARTILATDLNPTVTGVQFDTAAISGLITGSARGVDVVSQRNKGIATLAYSPFDELDIKFQYSNEMRSGTKPYGGTFSFNPVELLEPTQFRTQEALTSIEYAMKDLTVQLNYSASIFKNNVDVLEWDNPFREIDAVGSSSRGRIDLYPDNMAQNFGFSAAANLPLSTRLMATGSFGTRTQDDKFIPFTINTALDTLATFPKMPATRLNGKVGTTMMNVSLVNRFFSEVWINARFRLFDYKNETPSLIFPGYVSTDNSVSTVARGNVPIGYKRTNVMVDATLRMVKDVSLKVGFEREDWERKHRDAEKTNENIYKASLDYTPQTWLLVRTSFSLGTKKTPHYDAEEVAHIAFPNGEPATALAQLPLLRKFDMAARDRSRASALIQLTPLDILSITGSFGLTDDKFKESLYGMLSNKSNNFSVDLTVNPTYDLAFFASYTKEDFKYAMQSRQRVPLSGTVPANDSTKNDWLSEMKDGVNTYGVGLRWSIIPDQVDFSIDFSLSDGKGTTATKALYNPGTLPDPRFIVTTAQNYPDTRSILRQLRASLGYHLTDHFTPRLEYRFEGYSESYFNQDAMEPYMLPVDPATSGAVFLGARQPGYSAHIIYLILSYTF